MDPSKFYVYNYFKVPIDVIVTNSMGKTSDFLVKNILPKTRGEISYDLIVKYMRSGSKIKIYYGGELIGEAMLDIPLDKTIRGLYAGMNKSQNDISISGDITKSPLGSAIPRVRIVNTTPRTLFLSTGTQYYMKIPSGKSVLYFGQWQNGIHLGVTIKDKEGILDDFVISFPVTDIFMGTISDIFTPIYLGAKYGNALDDTVATVEYPLELSGIQHHRGADLDFFYIPKSW